MTLVDFNIACEHNIIRGYTGEPGTTACAALGFDCLNHLVKLYFLPTIKYVPNVFLGYFLWSPESFLSAVIAS